MIILTRLTGERFGLNPDLILSVDDRDHETVVALVTGKRYAVAETVEEVADLMLRYRMAIVSGSPQTTSSRLRLVDSRPNRS